MRISYFAHDLADAAVQKRVRMLRAGGAQRVTLLGFERGGPPAPLLGTPTFTIGHSAGGKFGRRLLSVITALPRAWLQRRHWARADTIIARNLEMLVIVRLLAPIVGARARIVYECLDIHRLMLREDRIGRTMRWIERLCMKRIFALLTSSPAFVAEYFKPKQNYDGKVLLVENKVFALETPRQPTQAPPAAIPYKVVWAGALRCARSFDILGELAEQGLIEVHLWGAPALDQLPGFYRRVAATSNMHFHGAYAAKDLPRVYSEAHFVWAVDYFEAGGNSEWLLPNRLYEGLFHGAVPIARENTETARWMEANKVGIALPEPLANSLRAFLPGAASQYLDLRRDAAALSPALLAFTREDCRALERALSSQEVAVQQLLGAFA